MILLSVSNFENYGCEFLDLEDHAPVYKKDTGILFFDVDFLRNTIDSNYQNQITTKNRNYIDQLRTDIEANGLKLPGTLVLSATSCKLQDGNHRFVACLELGYSKFPVKLQYSDGIIKSGGYKYLDFIQELFQTVVR